MFDERSGIWIKIYRGITIAMFWLCIFIGIIAGIIEVDHHGDLLAIPVGIILGFILGFIQLVTNMLIIQFLNNVQIIMEKLELR